MANPADKLIQAFDGVRPAARALGLHPATIQSWQRRGNIPSVKVRDVLKAARKKGADIDIDDLVP